MLFKLIAEATECDFKENVELSWPAFPILSLIITLNLLLEVNGAETKPLDRLGKYDITFLLSKNRPFVFKLKK